MYDHHVVLGIDITLGGIGWGQGEVNTTSHIALKTLTKSLKKHPINKISFLIKKESL